ncbi:MAG TPA: hypothetical protein PL112_04620 [Candidatus Obscuribacter sp.]|nr:hypothetical protein [Candidatus Obscuribacter sp.]
MRPISIQCKFKADTLSVLALASFCMLPWASVQAQNFESVFDPGAGNQGYTQPGGYSQPGGYGYDVPPGGDFGQTYPPPTQTSGQQPRGSLTTPQFGNNQRSNPNDDNNLTPFGEWLWGLGSSKQGMRIEFPKDLNVQPNYNGQQNGRQQQTRNTMPMPTDQQLRQQQQQFQDNGMGQQSNGGSGNYAGGVNYAGGGGGGGGTTGTGNNSIFNYFGQQNNGQNGILNNAVSQFGRGLMGAGRSMGGSQMPQQQRGNFNNAGTGNPSFQNQDQMNPNQNANTSVQSQMASIDSRVQSQLNKTKDMASAAQAAMDRALNSTDPNVRLAAASEARSYASSAQAAADSARSLAASSQSDRAMSLADQAQAVASQARSYAQQATSRAQSTW